jgi:hypothetical protein
LGGAAAVDFRQSMASPAGQIEARLVDQIPHSIRT